MKIELTPSYDSDNQWREAGHKFVFDTCRQTYLRESYSVLTEDISARLCLEAIRELQRYVMSRFGMQGGEL